MQNDRRFEKFQMREKVHIPAISSKCWPISGEITAYLGKRKKNMHFKTINHENL